MKNTLLKASILALALTLLSGCGIKGNLDLPEDQSEQRDASY